MNPRLISSVVAVLLAMNPLAPASAQISELPAPGTLVDLSKPYVPLTVKGLVVHADNPFQFDFVIDSGDEDLPEDQLKAESRTQIKYFLTALALPEDEMWVNLSPYEKDRVIPSRFGETQMGRDLLAQDYLLKQLTASLTYPKKDLGRKFWERISGEIGRRFGAVDVPINIFNKVWIVPASAQVHERGQSVLVAEHKLKVMLEEDYLAASKHQQPNAQGPRRVASQIVRDIIIPALEREVNEGAGFAKVRQVYQAAILASWYKIRLKDSLLGALYVDKGKISGVAQVDKSENQRIYRQYLQAFRKGVYQLIKDDIPADDKTGVPRKFVSGGAIVATDAVTAHALRNPASSAQVTVRGKLTVVNAQFVPGDAAMTDPITKASLIQDNIETVIRLTSGKRVRVFKRERRLVVKGQGIRPEGITFRDIDLAYSMGDYLVISRNIEERNYVNFYDLKRNAKGNLLEIRDNVQYLTESIHEQSLLEKNYVSGKGFAGILEYQYGRLTLREPDYFREAEFSKSKMEDLLTAMGQTGSQHKHLVVAVAWLNRTIRPFLMYRNDQKVLASNDRIKSLVPENIDTMSVQELETFASTAQGQKLKRRILFARFRGLTLQGEDFVVLGDHHLQSRRELTSSAAMTAPIVPGRGAEVLQNKSREVGGIDINMKNIELRIKRDDRGIVLPAKFQDLTAIRIGTLYPVIVGMKSVDSLSQIF